MADDLVVIRAVLGGETDAFRLLVERYERPVYGLARAYLADPRDREDVAQDSFLAAFEHLARFDADRAAFATWLLVITRNKCLGVLKRRRRRAPAPVAADVAPPQRGLQREETARRLDAALDTLSAEFRSVFVLADVYGLGGAEIATIEGISSGTVKSRLSRARSRLRQALGCPTELTA